MAKKLIKQWMPDPEKLKATPGLGPLGRMLEDPNLLHLNRHSVSIAFFVGLFCCFFPIPGQMILAGFLAFALRCNLPISVALVWISNPITIPPIFYATYRLGVWILGSPELDFDIELTWAWFAEEFPHLWQPLVVGSVLCGIFFGTLGYFSMQLFWRWHVAKSWKQRQDSRKLTK